VTVIEPGSPALSLELRKEIERWYARKGVPQLYLKALRRVPS
jgi:hypothetical protein